MPTKLQIKGVSPNYCRSRVKSIGVFLCSCALLLLVYQVVYIQIYMKSYRYFNPIVYNNWLTAKKSNESSNYFVNTEEYALKFGFIVKTSQCRILNISAWDKSILPFVSDEPNQVDCDKGKKEKRWTFVDGTDLVLNRSAIVDSGYSLESLSCCYKVIRRLPSTSSKDPEEFKTMADFKVIFDPPNNCFPMSLTPSSNGDLLRTPLDHSHEYLRVLCTSKFWPFTSDVVYRAFHATVQPSKSEKTRKKINFWKAQSQQRPRPPNIIVLGIDSMSRLSFQRNMPASRSYLQSQGAVEMLGYTKVGENTFPNTMASTIGELEEELSKGSGCLSLPLSTHFIDGCPFIWNDFSSQGRYLTALLEDVPHLATFNYMKLGFLNPPTDFYLRPYMLAVHEFSGKMGYTLDCIGRETVDSTILKYTSDLLHSAHNVSTPIFIYNWLTNLAHTNPVGGKSADGIYLDFLKRIIESEDQFGNNTILFFISDHGYRYGEIRRTFAGWMEDKLPNFWLYLPKGLESRWKETLEINSKRLTSPLDLHATLQFLLDEFSPEKTKKRSLSKYKGYSLLSQEIPPERKCSDAGISNHLCACVVPQKMDILSQDFTQFGPAVANHFRGKNPRGLLEELGHSVVNFINTLLPSSGICNPLKLGRILAGALLDSMDNESLTFVTTLSTEPGQFEFEASVDYRYGNNNRSDLNISLRPSDILRINGINPRHVHCLKNGPPSTKPILSVDLLERFCFCN